MIVTLYQRDRLTGDRLLVCFKLVNMLVGCKSKFATTTTTHRLGYWRSVLTINGAALPPLDDANLNHIAVPNISI